MDQIVEIQTDVTHRHLAEQERLQDDGDNFMTDDLGEIEYRPIPPSRVLKVQAKLRVAGSGKPLQYPLADEE